jgi:hypothetical protein
LRILTVMDLICCVVNWRSSVPATVKPANVISHPSFKNKTIVIGSIWRALRSFYHNRKQNDLVPVVPVTFPQASRMKLEGCATAMRLSRGVNGKWYKIEFVPITLNKKQCNVCTEHRTLDFDCREMMPFM